MVVLNKSQVFDDNNVCAIALLSSCCCCCSCFCLIFTNPACVLVVVINCVYLCFVVLLTFRCLLLSLHAVVLFCQLPFVGQFFSSLGLWLRCKRAKQIQAVKRKPNVLRSWNLSGGVDCSALNWCWSSKHRTKMVLRKKCIVQRTPVILMGSLQHGHAWLRSVILGWKMLFKIDCFCWQSGTPSDLLQGV